MAKITLQDVLSWFNAGPAIAANNRAIEAAIENTLSRDGASPNDMDADLDMGGHQIKNLAAPTEAGDAVRLQDIADGVEVINSVPWSEVTSKPARVVDVGNLVDPDADRLLFWDDSAGTLTYLTLGTNLSITGTTLNATGGSGGGVINPDSYPSSPDAMDDEFEGTSLNAKWTWRNQSTATATFGQGALVLTGLPISTSIHRVIDQPITGTGRWRAKVAHINTTNACSGFGFWRSANNNNIAISVQGTAARVMKWNNSTFSSNPASLTFVNSQLYRYYEVEYDGTNVMFRTSQSGIDGTFITHFTETAATFLGGAPDRLFFYVNQQNDGGTASQLIVDWVRKVA